MAGHRTKKHKVAQTARRQQVQYSLTETESIDSRTAVAQVKKQVSSDELFGYSIELIKKDILKTVMIGALIVAVLIGIVVFGQPYL
jgi:hypothetical protein